MTAKDIPNFEDLVALAHDALSERSLIAGDRPATSFVDPTYGGVIRYPIESVKVFSMLAIKALESDEELAPAAIKVRCGCSYREVIEVLEGRKRSAHYEPALRL